MPLSAGARLGVYEVTALIGEGGMGQVYRAHDTKLNRDVAIKVLPDLFAADFERLARFRREAQVLAALNHPHIAQIYGLDEANGTQFLVMELVDGESLDRRIALGPIPVDESVDIARQIAAALEAAHEKGIIHRDLKPANIALTNDGQVKVLDFGLAKASDAAGSGIDVANSPTLTSPATMTVIGSILGTAAYMSPEQAKGKVVDRRTDIFAFGCVLYEMLTGRRAFEGDTVTETLGSVLKSDPEWTVLPADTPASIRRLLRRCLQKDLSRRLQNSGDARLEIDDARVDADTVPARVAPMRSPVRDRRTWIAAALGGVIVGVFAFATPHFRTPSQAPEMRLDIVMPPTFDPLSFALSPDGRRLAFVAFSEGAPKLWVRSLDGESAQPLAGTDGASYPFWSPNGTSLAFFAAGKLKRIDVSGGVPQLLADANSGRGGAWGPDGVILFSPGGAGGLFRVSESGGGVVPVTKLDQSRHTSHRYPQFLPGGRFVFYAVGNAQFGGLHAGSLDSSEIKRVAAADTSAVYGPAGWLFFVRHGTLTAQRLDLSRMELTGQPLAIADSLVVENSVGSFSVAPTGLVAYKRGGGIRRQLVWFDRSGKPVGSLGGPDENSLGDPELTPDGRRALVNRTVQGNQDVWIADSTRMTRLTFDPSFDHMAVWSPDASRVAFDSTRRGPHDLYWKAASGADSDELVADVPLNKIVFDWSPDGRFLLYSSADPQTTFDLWLLPLDGDRKPRPFVNGPFDELQGQFSPNGRWVAYQSNESGRFDIYARPFSGPGGPWQVSTTGGVSPRWRADGKELFYVAPDGNLMAVPIVAQETTFEAGTPTPLFHARIVNYGTGTITSLRSQYDVAPDGRFLMNVATDDSAPLPITVIVNWKPPPATK